MEITNHMAEPFYNHEAKKTSNIIKVHKKVYTIKKLDSISESNSFNYIVRLADERRGAMGLHL